jgi:two-component system, OmpR family, phosphate regulon response regulator PhoB
MWSFASSPAAGARLNSSVPRTVLLLIAEPSVRQLLADDIRRGGLQVLPAASPAEAERLCAQVVPDVLVIDADDAPQVVRALLTGALNSGLQTAREPSRGESTGLHGPASTRTPCIVLASDSSAEQQAWCPAALWMRKPVHPRQLVAMLQRLFKPQRRPAEGPMAHAVRLGNALEVKRGDPSLHWLAEGRWRQLDLPHTEHRLLLALAEAAPRALNREQLRSSVWGDEPVTVRTVDQYVKRLRTRLATVGARDMVRTLRSFGYRLDAEAWQRPSDLKS